MHHVSIRSALPTRRLAAGALTALLLGGFGATVIPAAPALAAPSGDRAPSGDNASSVGGKSGPRDAWSPPGKELADLPVSQGVVGIAASKAGTPYAYGATGPGAFDCSGFTSWVYARVGRNLPRTSSAQAAATQRISAADARPGDLVFFTGSGGVYHVGIYAGANSVWHAPRPGEGVQRSQIWTSSVFYGRVR